MESIWMAIAPNATSTRVLAMAGAQDTILEGAAPALALSPAGHGLAARGDCALAGPADPRCSVCGRASRWVRLESLSRDVHRFLGGPLYTLDWIPALDHGRRARRHDIAGMGEFEDLRKLLIDEVAR